MKTTVVLLCVLIALTANATILQVPSQYLTIPAAHTAASNGDTILVAAGSYGATVTVTKRVTVIGAGYDNTIVTSFLQFGTGSSRSIVEGLRVVFAVENWIVQLTGTTDSLVLRRCVIWNTMTGTNYQYGLGRVSGTGGGRVFLDGCAFMSGANSGGYPAHIIGLGGESLVCRNCIFANISGNASDNRHSVLTGSWAQARFDNCVVLGMKAFSYGTGSFTQLFHCAVYDTSSGGAFSWNLPPGSVVDYCASEGAPPTGATNHITIGAGVNPFVNYNRTNNYVHGTSDLHPAPGSLLIDAGHPDAIDILDGTRMDIGLYGGFAQFMDGGIPNYPYVESMTVPPMITSGQDLQINAVGRIGRGY